MLDRILKKWRRPKIATMSELGQFLEQNAWLVSQKSVVGYCNVKTQLPIQELIKDLPFKEAYDRAILDSYAAALADLVVVAETFLRPHAGGRHESVLRALAALFEARLAAHPAARDGAGTWSEAAQALRGRLAAAAAKPPQSIRQISTVGSARIFAALPIHKRLRAPDAPAVEAGVQFLMVGLAHEFEHRLDPAALVADAFLAN